MDIIKNTMLKHSIYDFAFLSIEHVKFFDVKSKERIPQNAKTVIACIFPYYTKSAFSGNISAYCAVPDYHNVVKAKLNAVCKQLSAIYEGEHFEAFVDISPIDEVDMCVKAGLGVLGKHSLLINENYGSFVFIGEVVTTLKLKSELHEVKNCIGCNLCIEHCPGNAIAESGVSANLCASYLNQKKGELEKEEVQIVKNAGKIWGCDICQLYCPYNQYIKEVQNEFSKDIISTIDRQTVQSIYKSRAFGFKGLKILLRNFAYFD